MDKCEYDFLDDNSDEESSLSSNNDDPNIDIYLHNKYGTKLFKKSNESLDKLNVEDFENSMKNELDEMFKNYEETYNTTRSEVKDKDNDSLYDSQSDEENQNWVDDLRKLNLPKGQNKLPNSDAVLNCPSCMTLLCLDCQRHELYKTQYRAMFVHNCSVDETQNLYYSHDKGNRDAKKKRAKKRKQQSSSDTNGDTNENFTDEEMEDEFPVEQPIDVEALPQNTNLTQSVDIYKKVLCQICKTEVGVYDMDDVYHFHNVLSSYS